MKTIAAILLSALALFATSARAQTSYTWAPDGTSTPGGNGTWDNVSTVWWNGASSVNSTAFSAATSGLSLSFEGTGTITKLGETRLGTPDSDAVPTLSFAASSNYTILGSSLAPSQIYSGAHFALNVAPDANLTIGGDGNYIGILSGSSVSAGPGIIFGGGGNIDLRSGALIRLNSANSRLTILDGTTLTFHNNSLFTATSSGNFTSTPATLARIAIQSGNLVVSGGNVNASYHAGSTATGTRSFGIAIGSNESTTGNLTLLDGTITALGDPRSNGTTYAGIVFGYASTDAGGRADLDGGTLIVSNIRTQAAANAILSLNGVLVKITTAQPSADGYADITDAMLQNRLDRFITGFQNTDINHVVIGPRGVTFDTSLIDATRTNGIAIIASVMRGTGGITLQGPNALQIAAAQTYTGDTNIISGTLWLARGNSIATSGNITLSSCATIHTGNSGNASYLNQTLRNLSGSGRIIIGGSTLTMNSSRDTSFSGNITADSGSLAKTGSSTLDLTSISQLQNLSKFTITDGTLLADASTLTTDITNNANLRFHQRADTQTIRTHTINGTGNLTKTGNGTLLLSAQTSAGNITIEQGTLLLAGNSTLSANNITAQANTIFGGHGQITGNLNLIDATLQTGTSTGNTLNLNGGLTLAGNSTITFTLLDAGNSTQLFHNGTITDTGNLTLNIASAISGTYNLGNIAALANSTVTILGQTSNVRQNATLTTSGSDLLLTTNNDISRYLTWTNNAATNHWNSSDQNWTGSNNTTTFANGDSVTINNTGNSTITIDAPLVLSDLAIETTGDLTLAGNSIQTSSTAFAPGEITAPTAKLIKTGNATLTLDNTGANLFEGGIDLRAGTLAFTHGSQLNTSLNASITISGTSTLRPENDNLSITSNITVAGGSTATIDTSTHTLAIDARISSDGSSTLNKTGSGKLILNLAHDYSAHLGTTTISDGTLSLHTGDSVNTTWSSPLTGAGNLEKTGNGTLSLALAPANTGTTTVTAGTLRAAFANVFNGLSPHFIASAATLDLGGFDQSIASLHNDGTIAFTANINNTLGLITRAQTLNVNGNASGSGTLLVVMTEAPPSETTGTPTHTILSVNGSSTASYTLSLDRRYTTGLYDWTLTREGNNYILGRETSPEIPAIGAAETVTVLASQAAFASLSNRFSNTHLALYPTAPKRGTDLWFASTYQSDKITTSLYDGASTDTQLFQIGFDYTGADQTFTTGIAFDYARSDTTLPSNSVSTSSNTDLYGINLYFTHQPGSWYFNFLVRLNNAKTTAHIPQTPDLSIDSSGLGGSIELGYNLRPSDSWLIQPQFQYVLQSISTDPVTDSFNRTYNIGTSTSSVLRGGFLISKLIQPASSSWRLRPYARASALYECQGNTGITATSPIGPASYHNDLSGLSAQFNLGALFQLSDTLSFSADFAGTPIGPVTRYALNLNIALKF